MTPESIREFLRTEVESRRRFALLGTTTDGPERNPKRIKPPAYYGMADLIVQHGQPFQPKPLPRGHKLNTFAKQCFFNCYRAIARKTTPWVYVEGYAVTDKLFMPVHHAWLTRKDDMSVAYDPTWQINLSDTWTPENSLYLGIPIRREYVIEMHRLSRRQWFSVFDTWWADYPLLTGKVKLEAIAA